MTKHLFYHPLFPRKIHCSGHTLSIITSLSCFVILVGFLNVFTDNLVIRNAHGKETPQPHPCETGSVGTVCLDGAIYAGSLNGVRFYAAPNDEPGTKQWSDAYVNTGATSTTDGLYNTYVLVYSGSEYQAANVCQAIGTEWYLPSKDELNVMYDNREAIGMIHKEGAWYWASSESPDFNNIAWRQRFSDGVQTTTNKDNTHLVRCVRH